MSGDEEPQQLQVDSNALLGPTAIEAGVQALAQRNQHHFQGMSEQERAQAIETWRELTTDVLGAAHAVLFGGQEQPNRAIVIFEDGGGEDVAVHASFTPQLQDVGNGQVAGTPAQITALSLL